MRKKIKASLLSAFIFCLPFSSFSAELKSSPQYPDSSASTAIFDAGASGSKSLINGYPDFSFSAEPQYISGVKTTRAGPPGRAGVYNPRGFTGFPDAVFSDDVRIDALLIRAIDASNSSIEIAMYGITLPEVVDALIRAKTRNVKVRIVIDESHVYQKDFPEIKRIIKEGFDIRTLRGSRDYGVMHNKIAVFDGSLLMIGSYNWTNSATLQNCENVVFTSDTAYGAGYKKYWEWMWNYTRTIAQGPSPQTPEGYFGTPPADPRPSINFNGLVFPKYLFSPKGGAENGLITAIRAAKKNIDVVTYTFSSKPLADAIISAHKAGIRVRLLIDTKMGGESKLAKYCLESGVNIKFRNGRGSGAMHNKFAVFDNKLLETGSFNWTSNAELNSFENVMLIDNASLVNKYAKKYEYYFSTGQTPSPGNFNPNAENYPQKTLSLENDSSQDEEID